MALNWVMTRDNNDFIPLPNERTVFKSSHRTSLALTSSKSTYPAHSPNLNIISSDGTVYLSNQRVIYIPKQPTPTFKSFSCPLLNLHDTHLVMPWFGPNAWVALVQPVQAGGLPNSSAAIELKFTFKEGGAPDFQGKFEAIKERLQQVVENARESNTGVQRGGPIDGVDMANVHLDELPRYEDSSHDRIAPILDQPQEPVVVPTNATADQVRAMAAAAATQRQQEHSRRQSREEEDQIEPPTDAPPGYEEAQQQTVQAAMAWRSEQEPS